MAKKPTKPAASAKSPSSSKKPTPAAKPAAAAKQPALTDLRHPQATRKNNPPATLASEGIVPTIPKANYAYNPHLPPVLRFDSSGTPDHLATIAAKLEAKQDLTHDERALATTLLQHLSSEPGGISHPWLEWTNKRELPSFAVDPVALHIHERVSAQAILKVAARQDVNKDLFADPEQDYKDAVQFYKHDVNWSNRLILGDSLQVMSSLARREDLAGKVQMIYMDPPYGIKFASNFQPEVGKRDVKDKQEDLTREPEMVRAYRDTWHLGIHSYLSYLRDRLIVAKELLADTGSIFVQISEENLHRLRNLLDEVFGAENFCSILTVAKTSGASSPTAKTNIIASVCDYVLWYARNAEVVTYRQLFREKAAGDEGSGNYRFVETADGVRRTMSSDEMERPSLVTDGQIFRLSSTSSQTRGTKDPEGYVLNETKFVPEANRGWSTTIAGLGRLENANRLVGSGNTLSYVRYVNDFSVSPLPNFWADTNVSGFGDKKVYVVQTLSKIIERCMLMTTDPGDLVLDPTCGSGTTAYVAEQWGRRWITTDTSRVAVAIARQRLLTSKFDMYRAKASGTGHQASVNATGQPLNPASGFVYKTVPHITLKSIAQNVALDPIFARHEPILAAALEKANASLKKAIKQTPSLPTVLAGKLATKEKNGGKRTITDADRRRWLLPPANREVNRDKGAKLTVDANFPGWYHWEVPFDTDAAWPEELSEAVLAYRAAWRAKMDEVNACIAASAEQEELVDQPEIIKNVVRVSGPFTVEGVQPPELSLGDVVSMGEPASGPGFAGAPDELDQQFPIREVVPTNNLQVANVGAYLDAMLRYLRADGVRFLNNKQMVWSRLDAMYESGKAGPFHAEGRWAPQGEADADPHGRANVAVVIGPQYGPVTQQVVADAVRLANIRGYEHLVIAAFNFDAAALTLSESKHRHVTTHLAHIRPDINPGMNGLLKESPKPGSGQLFTVFGQPRISVEGPGKKGSDTEGLYIVKMEGVDIYDPVRDEITPTNAGKVAAWFLDTDYDGITFCITQAFFPDKSAWDKLRRALNGKDGLIDEERFDQLSKDVSLPFPRGKHGRIAVKVIDPRGNEVMAVEEVG